MNCIVGKICSAGTPLSTWMFLNCSSAFLPAACGGVLGPPCGVALDCAFTPATTKLHTASKAAMGRTSIRFAFMFSVPQLECQEFTRGLGGGAEVLRFQSVRSYSIRVSGGRSRQGRSSSKAYTSEFVCMRDASGEL